MNANIKDPASGNLVRGFSRTTNLPAITLLTATVVIARNLRTADAFHTRQAQHEHHATNRPPTRRRRRRDTIEHLLTPANSPP